MKTPLPSDFRAAINELIDAARAQALATTSASTIDADEEAAYRALVAAREQLETLIREVL